MKRAFTTCFKIDRILVCAEGGRFLHTGRPPPTFYNQPTCRGHCLLTVVSFCFARAFDIAAVAAAVPAQVAAALLHVVDSRNQGKQGVGCWQRPLYQGCQKKVGGRQHLEASPRRHALCITPWRVWKTRSTLGSTVPLYLSLLLRKGESTATEIQES